MRSVDVKQRQLAGWQRRAVGSTIWSVFGYVAISTLLCAPLLLPASFGAMLLADGSTSLGGFFWFCSPIAVGMLAAVGGLRWVAGKRAALELAAAAVPPAAPGRPATCRVCGGPLEIGDSAIHRCDYCQADNLVSAAVLERAGRVKIAALEDVASAVRAKATDIRTTSRRAGCAVAGVGCFFPIVLIITTTVIASLLHAVEADLDDSHSYAIVESSAGRCMAEVSIRPGKVRISYGGRPESGAITPEDRSSIEGLELLSPRFLVGRHVLVYDRRVTGMVVRVHGTLLGSNVAVVRRDDGDELDHNPAGLCILNDDAEGS